MSKTLRYGEFAFGKNGSSLKNLPAKGEGGGRRLVQFYAGGGKVRKAPAPGLEGGQEASFAPAPTKMPPAPKGASKGALSAMAKPPKVKGAPDLMARARISGGMKDGGAISDAEARRRMAQGSISDAEISKGIGSSMKKAYAKGGAAHSDVAMDKKVVKTAVHKHERAMHPGKPVTKLARGGVPAHSRKPMYGGGKC